MHWFSIYISIIGDKCWEALGGEHLWAVCFPVQCLSSNNLEYNKWYISLNIGYVAAQWKHLAGCIVPTVHFRIHSQDFISLLQEDGGTAECAYIRRVSDLCLDTNYNWMLLHKEQRHSYIPWKQRWSPLYLTTENGTRVSIPVCTRNDCSDSSNN